MTYQTFDQLLAQVKDTPKRTVAVAAAHDAHALEAVLAAEKEGLVAYRLVGDRARILAIAEELGAAVDPSAIVDAGDDGDCAFQAVRLIREGEAAFLMKGKLETATLMRAVLNKETGIRTGSTMSHTAILELPAYPKLLAITDGGMIPHPTLEQKGLILQNSVDLFRSLGYDRPKVAVLAASETVNDRMPETADGKALKEQAAQGVFGSCVVEGPMPIDLVLSPESARIKGFESPVVGDADILLAPDIACGNVLTKALLYAAGARMAGCIVGAKAPIVLTSRGATAEEKHLSILLSAAIASS